MEPGVAQVAEKDDLDQLLELEQRLAARLDQTRVAAAQIVERAREEARALARRAEEDERIGRARIAEEAQSELAAGLERLEAGADQRLRIYTSVTEAGVQALAESVLRALLEDEAVPR